MTDDTNQTEQIRRLKRENQKLRRTADHFRTLFMNAPLGLFRSTFQGRFTQVNPALAEMLGYDSPEAVIEGITSIGDQVYADTERRREILEDHQRQKGIQHHTNLYKRKDGTTFVANLYLRTIYERDGTPVHLEGIVEDITEISRLQEKLAESEKRHRLILESISDAVFITDRQGGFTYICPNTGNIFGYSLPELASLESVSAFFPHPIFDETALEPDGELVNIRTRITDRNGQAYHLLVNVRDVSIGKGRRLYTCRDVTDITRIARALEEEKRQFDTIINELPQFVSYTDRDLTYRFVNRTYESVFNVRLEEIRGKSVASVIGNAAFEKARPHVERALSGERVSYREHFDYPGGRSMTIDGLLIPHFNGSGRVEGYFAILSDITSAESARRELESRAAKLEQMNTALNVLVDHRNEKKEQRETEIVEGFEKLVFPYFDLPLERRNPSEVGLMFTILEKNIREILSGTRPRARDIYRTLTPLEVKVADLIKADRTTKEIADLLNLSPRTVYFHRENIRKKLNLTHGKINLKTFLQSR